MSAPPAITAQGVTAWYDDVPVLRNVNLVCPAGEVTAIIGPTEAGKSTFLRVINRLAEETGGFRRAGRLLFGDDDVFALSDPVPLRRRAGLVPAKPTLFRGSVRDNVTFGPRLAGVPQDEQAERVETALRGVDLWAELESHLDRPAADLAPGERQRLCIARALALRPEVLLLDEPTRRLDTLATSTLEEVVLALRGTMTVVLVSHDAQQAGRLADVTAFFDRGTVVEAGPTEQLFTRPRDPATEAYLSRRYA